MSLYLWINILSISVPLAVSFHPRIKLYKSWPSLFAAIFLVLIPYIIWDIYFTQQGFWGFNETYLLGVFILDLPIEEWLFFICIPYACIFTHKSVLTINPKLSVSPKSTKVISAIIATVLISTVALNTGKAYTAISGLFALVALALAFKTDKKLLGQYYCTFLFMLIPFFIVNGILTGSFIADEVVWYNDVANLGIRLFTIPIEDVGYAFSLLLLNLLLYTKLNRSM
ncbi:MAG: lycopene cyclase domain-containing protein [Nitrosomonadales bacterium]|jgi:lycopene cyclase domain-containing protein|nr:lycopene cyclase domain-containing protein [Nitrosomonadales bacterium]